MMKNSVQIVLFFEKNEIFNPSKIATLINEQIEEIGSPIILPMGAPEEANIPILVFSQNNKINLTANFNNVSITLEDDMIEKSETLVTKIFDIFEENKYVRIGTIINKVLNKETISNIKEETNCNETVLEAKDFKIAWLQEIDLANVKINMWKNYFSDKSNTENILCVYDFNTKPEDNIEVTKEFAIKFLEECKNNI